MRFRFPRRPLRAVLTRALAALALFLAASTAAQSQSQPKSQPQRVWMGMYVVHLGDFDLKSGSYSGDFYLWVRWDGPQDATNFEVMNGTGDPCPLGFRRQQGAVRYAIFRCVYRFRRSFDLSDYPLDEHELTVEVEDKVFTETELVYVPDSGHTALDPGVGLPGWEVGKPRMRVETHTYTSLGDPTRPPGDRAPYSKLVISVPVRREGAAIYLKSFLVMFLSVGVGLLGSALSCRHVEARLGVGVASIFGVVSSYLVVSQALPETSQFTLADQLHLVGMASVFLSIVVSVTAYRLCGRVGEERAERLDRILGLVTGAGFVAAVLAVTFLR